MKMIKHLRYYNRFCAIVHIILNVNFEKPLISYSKL